MPLVVAVLAPLAVPSAALAERWLRPIPGEVARSFSYSRAAPFVAGAHRGVDFAARAGTAVRAACGGRVVHAARVAGPHAVVSIRCGQRRVSYLPLASLAVRAGTAIRAGTPLGTVAAGHGGLHLGVRTEADAFGYEDPLALLPRPGRPLPAAPRAADPRRRAPRVVRPRSVPPARPAPRLTFRHLAPRGLPGGLAPRELTRPDVPPPAVARPPSVLRRPPSHTPRTEPAPWPVWAGLAVLLSGVAGSGTVMVRRRRRPHDPPELARSPA
ncbi:MAG: murein hydrolase activator EnvC family protein [Solirubrobacteraceae bacterium]